MALLDGENVLKHPSRGRVAVAERARDFTVTFDRDPLGGKILLDHRAQILGFAVFGMAAFAQRVGAKIRRTAKLCNPLGKTFAVCLLFVRVREEFAGNAAEARPRAVK